ncbi:unnamed protein product, partial [Discosporangium mesarthrocarpum]
KTHRTDRLASILPGVMDAAIQSIRVLDDQVFEEMVLTSAPEGPPRTPLHAMSRRMSRVGGGEFFARSPGPRGNSGVGGGSSSSAGVLSRCERAGGE